MKSKNDSKFHYQKWIMINYNLVPELPGCYAIYINNIKKNEKKLLYIGTSKNLRKRIWLHPLYAVLEALLEPPESIIIKLRFINKNRLKYEKYFIKRLKPKINKRIG